MEFDVNERKREIRAAVRAARASIAPEERDALSRAASERLLSLAEINDARVVMAYCATAEEIDPNGAVEALRSRGARIAFPRVEAQGRLRCCEVSEGDVLETGPMEILQPSEDAGTVEPEELDAVIVPGVAFDPAGGRLGYGGGYYDRLLPQLRQDCVLIGFGFDQQVVDELPVLEHDRRVDVVVTPMRVVRPGTGS